MYWDGGHMGWMWFSWVVGLVLFVLMVRWVATSSGGRTQERESPEEILKRRYALGEIGREEYLRRLDELRR
jgi:putative membrane protein